MIFDCIRCEESILIITCNIKRAFLLKVLSIKSTNLSLIRLWGKVVFNVEKSYVDKLDARKPRDFRLFNTSHEFLIDQKKIFTGPFIDFFTIFNNVVLIAVRQEISKFDSSVVVHELELAINRAFYVFCAV